MAIPRQSSGDKAPRNSRESMKPGGPVDQPAMGYENPGPTRNLRGVEPNTAKRQDVHRPVEAPTGAHGHGGTTAGKGKMHHPGFAEAGNAHGHGISTTLPDHSLTASAKGKPSARPTPGDSDLEGTP